MRKICCLILFLVFAVSCNSQKKVLVNNKFIFTEAMPLTKKLSEEELKIWWQKDIINDSIPGISWEKCNTEILRNKKEPSTTIIALIDTEIDTKNTEISNNLWRNDQEIVNNRIDDDKNGYIDDTNGWNFIGNDKGENIIQANYDYVRIVKYFQKKFENKTIGEIQSKDTADFTYYTRAKAKYEKELLKSKKNLRQAEKSFKKFTNAELALKTYFPNSNYSLEKLKSIDTVGNGLGKHVNNLSQLVKYKISIADLSKTVDGLKEKVTKRLNIEFNERTILKDNPNDLGNTGYGNHLISANSHILSHGTRVAGVLVSGNLNSSMESIKIMPLCISPFGDQHDKDIALAIRYAVDKGAKVINMSFGKEFSLHKDFVFEAFRYAEKNNVVIVSSAGNSRLNLSEVNDYYPNDNIDNGQEVSDNFILVGASTPNANNKLCASFSNYGKTDVDIFAPASKIWTSFPNEEYKFDKGTSLGSAIVSKLAALIFSYYPNLTASEVKRIILDSGVTYNLEVNIPSRKKEKTIIPFSELSKTGKIVNAYNALLLAEKMSKK